MLELKEMSDYCIYITCQCISMENKHARCIADESDEEGERPSRRRRLAERAAEGGDDDEEVSKL